ncbi:thymidine phosphorylase [candidate division KSB1 bacterium]|nr:thymidine phosphorylase [candidate division KSB1 bacterium]
MLIVELIAAKQRGEELTDAQIGHLISRFAVGKLPDYQMAALLMATYFRGLTDREGRAFLRAMVASGVRLDLSSVPGVKVDKHSTGGVGDKTSLIVAPVVAAAGVPVPMISGRALGHTGGTLDKLESIPGFRVRLDDAEFRRVIRATGGAFGAQTDELVPADRKLYALRDVTSTVAIPPLIAASILSKKIAEGTNALVMDVKIGSGGFLPSREAAESLAKTLVTWSRDEQVTTVVFGTDMEQPLGRACGNAPEVRESLDLLRTGTGDQRLLTVCRALGSAMILLGGRAADRRAATALFDRTLASGAGYEKFKAIAAEQGAAADVIDHYDERVRAAHSHELRAARSGYLSEIAPREIGLALVDLGAGRAAAGDPVDHTAGIVFDHQRGDYVNRGERIATILWSGEHDVSATLLRCERAISVADTPPVQRPLIQFYCDQSGVSPYRGDSANG